MYVFPCASRTAARGVGKNAEVAVLGFVPPPAMVVIVFGVCAFVAVAGNKSKIPSNTRRDLGINHLSWDDPAGSIAEKSQLRSQNRFAVLPAIGRSRNAHGAHELGPLVD
jgi:hypothetical protein